MIQKKLSSFILALFLAICIGCLIMLSSMGIQAQDTILEKTNLKSSSETENSSPLTLERATLATAVIDREPEGVSNKFSRDIEKIYFFTQVLGAQEPTVIYHHWYYEGKLMAEVELPVKSSNWRTYSSKRILPNWVGNWSVEALDAEGRVLEVLSFEIN